MSILVYTESENGKFKKSALELASYGRAIADELGIELVAVSFNHKDPQSLAKYGVDRVIQISDPSLDNFTAQHYAANLTTVAKENDAKLLVLSSSSNAKYLAPLLAVSLSAGYASNVVELPESLEPLTVKRSCYTNKAFNTCVLENAVNIIGLSNNSYGLRENLKEIISEDKSATPVETNLAVENIEKSSGEVSIADADIVVSGGRGLKGPENWHLIEDLASTLGAATACSKPVSDMGWRPHSEHVGQTGKPVASNLYIAIGVSGAIQHLAGINSSKVKVVINNDPEAPFFKAADYGVIGDAFEVVPELIEKLKAFKDS
ncbi:electron transfer flavoprotein subunit alpha/FixB family protein [Flavobacteriaceae bacterium]|nr:electron transfer flavoprotein subunit alpha/FixB family protein [Flavobacteriaceae bacterium]MDB2314564.1 electron transfer flavoprotein subunit alpha/FixB family protein [Flavobacteriaceae bacterium]MDB2521092.1 electron transfer flavoprotein subunit alpha/FixB family protein [Flavobacteriaceae bacterium]MDC0479176.1 electron transfer flavoprotein subunit alpha/FixB family protein [Flavobacteriaceae bacterium]